MANTVRCRRDLSEVGFERPEQIGATFVGDATFVKRAGRGHSTADR